MGQFLLSRNAIESLWQNVQSYWEAALRLLYPASCALCPVMLELEERHVCRACRRNLSSLRLEPDREALVKRSPWVRRGWSLYRYDAPLSEIISSVKFSKKWWLLDIFDADLRNFCFAGTADLKYDWVLPIPLDRGKRIHREFNQSERLAKKISRFLEIPLNASLLKKRHPTPAQSSLDKKAREANLFGAFEARHKNRLAGKTILLVDDIFTTGATTREASRILKQAGAKHVDILALARTEIS